MAKPDLSGDHLSPDAGCGICRVLDYTAAQRGDVTFVNRPSHWGGIRGLTSEDEKQSREKYEITILGCARRYVTIQDLCPNIISRAAYHRRPLSPGWSWGPRSGHSRRSQYARVGGTWDSCDSPGIFPGHNLDVSPRKFKPGRSHPSAISPSARLCRSPLL